MKLLVLLEIELSKTMADTIQRTGLELVPDGPAMKVKIPHAPIIPRRKIKVSFNTDPLCTYEQLMQVLEAAKVSSVVDEPQI